MTCCYGIATWIERLKESLHTHESLQAYITTQSQKTCTYQSSTSNGFYSRCCNDNA